MFKVKFDNGVVGQIPADSELKEFLNGKFENGESVHGCADVDGEAYTGFMVSFAEVQS